MGRRIIVTFPILVAAGTQYQWWPYFGDPLNTTLAPVLGNGAPLIPHRGKIRAVQARLVTGGGWTMSSAQIRIAQPERSTLSSQVSVYDPSLVFGERVLYDSGAFTPGGTPSDTLGGGDLVASAAGAAPYLRHHLGSSPMEFDGPFTVGLVHATSAGAGASSIVAEIDLEEEC